jgi:DNA-binding GntR family transcriptional regulator
MTNDLRRATKPKLASKLGIERPLALAVLVQNRLRDMIITGEFAFGEVLSENTIADQLGVSRTPVREAFMRLALEGLVEIHPQRGTFVYQCEPADFLEISELRVFLECGALRGAMERNYAGLCDALAENLSESEKILVEDASVFEPLDRAFHQAIIDAAGNRRVRESYQQISSLISALRYRVGRIVPHNDWSLSAHRAVFERIRQRDVDGAEEALRAHVYVPHRILVRLFEEGHNLDTSPVNAITIEKDPLTELLRKSR